MSDNLPFVPRFANHPWKKRMLIVRKCDECPRSATMGSLKCAQHGVKPHKEQDERR
jgi:hypothetical protein